MIVIGVGNVFRRDDGAGPAVIERLRGRVAATLAITDGEPARLIDLWDGADLAVVVDAVRAAPPRPGRIHELGLNDLARLPTGAPSSHALGLGDAVQLGRAVGMLPRRLHVIAIEGTDFRFGPDLSPPVAAAVVEAARRIGCLDEAAAEA